MAKLVQQNVLVTVSRVIKDSDAIEPLSAEELAVLEAAAAEIFGSHGVVEAQIIPDA